MAMIAYSPMLQMADGYVGTYKIYVLKDPFTQEVFYVGQTIMDLGNRLSGHLSNGGGNLLKQEFIKSIINRGAKPTIEPIETIRATCYIDKILLNQREIYWIKYYKALGIKILNSALMTSDAESREYAEYLTAIKLGKGSYHYYYCGKTYGGHDVYDEEKMKADGFRLPTLEKPKERIVEKIVVQTQYIERPKVKTITFPEQPSWTKDFRATLLYDDFFDMENGFDVDESDFEPDQDEYEEYPENDEPEMYEFDFKPE